VIWDTSATVTDEGMQKLPLGDESGQKVVVKYPSDGGYSPGDTWDVYVGTDGRVQEFVYHRGGPKKPSTVIAPWTDYKKAGPLLFSLDHQSKADDAPVHIFFSNVAVKMTDQKTGLTRNEHRLKPKKALAGRVRRARRFSAIFAVDFEDRRIFSLGRTIEDLSRVPTAVAFTDPVARRSFSSVPHVRYSAKPDEPEYLHNLRNDVHQGHASDQDQRRCHRTVC
jgi:hypothetical protein